MDSALLQWPLKADSQDWGVPQSSSKELELAGAEEENAPPPGAWWAALLPTAPAQTSSGAQGPQWFFVP